MTKTMKRSGQIDLLHGPILKNLILFMVPIFISQAFQQFYNAADTAIVGHVLGEHSLAAIGACAAVFDLFVGFAMSLANGFAIVISRAYGSGKKDQMKRAIAGSIVIGTGTAIVITIVSMFGLSPLLTLIHTPAEVFEESLEYIRIIALFLIVMFAYNLASGILRAIGNSVMPLIFLVFSSLLNIFLDYAFMEWFGMGVGGAAIATVISQAIAAVLCILYILFRVKELVPEKKHFQVRHDLYTDLAGQGYSMAFMGSIVNVGSIILQSGINSLGTEIIAGHVAARKVYAVMNLPFISMGTAISTFIGQNRGADQGQRILTAMKDSFLYDLAAAAVVSVFLWLTAPALIRLISGSDNPVILENGSSFLYVVGPFYAVLGVLMQTRFALQGLGSKLIPLISSVIECVGKIIFTFFLIPPFGYTAVIWCEPLIWCVMTVQLLYSFMTNPYIRETRRKRKA